MATPAHAASGDCVTAGDQTTCTFEYTGADQTWTVPDGVTAATFELVGAPGGAGFANVPGGKGARVSATLSLTRRIAQRPLDAYVMIVPHQRPLVFGRVIVGGLVENLRVA